METIFYILASTVSLILEIVMTAMFVRSILSWFIQDEDNGLHKFLCIITEPFIIPVRFICYKLNIFQDLPIDIPYLITYILLFLLTIFI